MTARRKRRSKRPPPLPAERTSKPDSPAVSSRRESSKPVSVENALDECVGALCLVEVVMHSLESQEIAFPEQAVLKRALKAIWSVHDWIYDLGPGDLEGKRDREDES